MIQSIENAQHDYVNENYAYKLSILIVIIENVHDTKITKSVDSEVSPHP